MIYVAIVLAIVAIILLIALHLRVSSLSREIEATCDAQAIAGDAAASMARDFNQVRDDASWLRARLAHEIGETDDA